MKKYSHPQNSDSYPDLWGLVLPLGVVVVLVWIIFWIIVYA